MMGLIGKDVQPMADIAKAPFDLAIADFIREAKSQGYTEEDIAVQSIAVAAAVMVAIVCRTTVAEKALETIQRRSWLFPDVLEEAIDETFYHD